jgi:AcrR family transcriptional regulator
VANVIRRDGLTHGGFYAHFASKEDLLAEAVVYASEQVNSILETPLEEDASAHRLLSAVSFCDRLFVIRSGSPRQAM